MLTSPEEARPYPTLKFELVYDNGTGEYEGNLTGMSRAGLYKIVAFAEDTDHEVADPLTSYISVAGSLEPGNLNETNVQSGADVNRDGNIGIAELIYIFQRTGGL